VGKKYICPKGEPLDTGVNSYVNKNIIAKIDIIKEVWNGLSAEKSKKLALFITIVAVLIGILLEKINDLIGFELPYVKEITGGLLGFFLTFTYTFGLLIGFLSYIECREYIKCDIKTRIIIIFMKLVRNILVYLVPSIIVVSLLASVYNSVGPKSTSECGTNNFNINIPEEVQNIIIYIGFGIFIISVIYFEYMSCSKDQSFFSGLLIMFLIIIANFFLINLIVNSYSNLLSANFGIEKYQYWALFIISVIVYMITCMRASAYEGLISNIIDNGIKVLPSCVGIPEGTPINNAESNNTQKIPIGGSKKKKK